jgi:hypothetical protein
MTTSPAFVYVVIDGKKYAVSSGTFIRRWPRAFSTDFSSNVIRLNFVDHGPGVRVYSMTLYVVDWTPDSAVYKAGVTQSLLQQKDNIDIAYAKNATPISFLDPFGEPPLLKGSTAGSITSLSTTVSIPPTENMDAILSGGQSFPCTAYIWDNGSPFGFGNFEQVTVTAFSSSTFTMIRGQGGTTAVSHASGSNIATKIGVYMTSVNQIISNWSSVEKPYLEYEIELTEATQVIL